MLKATIDSSLLNSGPEGGGNFTPQLSLLFVGLHWEEKNKIPERWKNSKRGDDIVRLNLFPWHWVKPDKARIYWLKAIKENETIVKYEIVNKPAVINLERPGEIADSVAMTDRYETVLADRIWSGENKSFDANQIIWDPTKHVTVDDHFEYKNEQTGFLRSSIAQFAQKFAPLNRALNLVFFAKDQEIIIPENADHFVVFPEGGWWEIDKDPVWIPESNSNFYSLSYKSKKSDDEAELLDIPFAVSSIVTEIKAPEYPGSSPVKLRNTEGEFQGTVQIKASDTPDWTSGLAGRLGTYFNLQKLFFHFIQSNAEKELIWDGPDDTLNAHVEKIKRIDDYLLSVSRDSLGSGYKETSDGSSVLRAVVMNLCEKQAGKLYELNAEDQKKYWGIYHTYYEKLKKYLEETESAYTKQDWRKLFFGLKTIMDWEKDVKLINEWKIEGENKNLKLIWNDAVKKWWKAWEKIVDLTDNRNLQEEVIITQWENLSWNKLELSKEDVLSALNNVLKSDNTSQKIQDIRAISFENIIITEYEIAAKDEIPAKIIPAYIKNMIGKGASVENSKTEIVKNLKAEVRKFSKDRLENPVENSIDKKRSFLEVSDPFQGTADSELSYEGFGKFIEETLNEQLGTEDTKLDEKTPRLFPYQNYLFLNEEEPSQNPPSVRLTIDQLGVLNTDDDDLSDEIAGHIVLMRRGADLAADPKDVDVWQYLNKIEVVKKEKDAAGKNVPILKNPYLVPTPVPEVNGVKKPFLQLSNEKLSLIASGGQFDDEIPGTDAKDYLLYQDDDSEKIKREFWYGYKYQFAGFVALNSGVLPKYLRDTGWNKPRLDLLMKPPAETPIQISDTYTHLRRVPVSKVRAEVVGKILQPPKGLLPLAFELDEWKQAIPEPGGSSVTGKKQKERVHCLLAKTDSFSQDMIVLDLKKPATPFLNWYAWMGKELDKPLTHIGYPESTLRKVSKDINKSNRETPDKNKIQQFYDPAVENEFVVKVKRVFPTKHDFNELRIKLNYPAKQDIPEDEWRYLRDVSEKLTIIIGAETSGDTKTIIVAPGDIIQVMIHAKIEAKHFDNSGGKFFGWMKNELGAAENGFYLSPPAEFWFEAAKPLDLQPDLLWENMRIQQIADKVNCSIEKDKKMSYASRVEIKHQIWNWNGRLENSGLLKKNDIDEPDPKMSSVKEYETSNVMKWEAWAFSDRPDYDGQTAESNLLALSPDKEEQQILFSHYLPNEEKALYYRFSAVAYSRYEKLGGIYNKQVEAKIPVKDKDVVVENPWKRYFRRCSKTKPLPAPSIRFVIPLTRSIREQNEMPPSAASLLVVMNGHWFSEAGLAQQLEIGVDIVKDIDNDEQDGIAPKEYGMLGHDPILSGKGLPPLKTEGYYTDPKQGYPYVKEYGEKKVAVFKPAGVAGLTFEPKMQTPQMHGASFILKIPDVSGLLQNVTPTNCMLGPWTLMQIAARTTLREDLCEEGLSIPALISPWTAKEWVQFLPAADFFIPTYWREQVRKNGAIGLNFEPGKVKIPGTELPGFDSNFEEINRMRMQRYLVVTEKVYDIGGQPCESYVATYWYDPDNKEFILNHTRKDNFNTIQEGHCRVLLVRIDVNEIKNNNQMRDEKPEIWEMLFGENLVKPDIQAIQNDPKAALPMISERIPYKTII